MTKKTGIQSYITETHDTWHKGHISPFWLPESFKILDYSRESFNNPRDVEIWRRQGYTNKYFTGKLCDMRKTQTNWNSGITQWFEDTYLVKDVGTSYYCMNTSVILPAHGDTYKKYREIFDCELQDCVRVIVFLEDWKSGHVFEIENTPITDWNAGDYVYWEADTRHFAANIGLEDRYTLQLTGHK